MNDLTGTKFGRLTVLSYEGRKVKGRRSYSLYRTKCDCGSEQIVMSQSLTSGRTLSCGCLHKETITTHGASKTKTYSVWYGMKRRCTDKYYDKYKEYGAKGITVSNEWLEFSTFLADMGEVPKGYTLERIDNAKGYCKENCKWATPKEQANNRTNNRKLEYKNRIMSCSQIAHEVGLKPSTLWNRIFIYGWPLDKAVATPSKGVR